MVKSLTFNIANSNGKTFTMLTENKNFINSIITVQENNTINNEDIIKLQQVASKNGDAGILEMCDLDANQKLKLMDMNGYSKPYSLELSDDKKMLKIKVNKTKGYYPNPQLKTIKSDFGIGDNVLVTKNGIPYGNEAVINKRAEAGSSVDGRNTDFNVAELEAGDVINIPIALVKPQEKPQGFWERPWF